MREGGFSSEMVSVLEAMLTYDEGKRPDFIELAALLTAKIGEEPLQKIIDDTLLLAEDDIKLAEPELEALSTPGSFEISKKKLSMDDAMKGSDLLKKRQQRMAKGST